MLSALSCNFASNSFAATSTYLLGPFVEQLTELNGSAGWLHTNVFAAGLLLATYDANGTHFALNDWLGTKRIQASAGGAVDETCLSLPFGDSLTCTGPAADATEHHFTGKEQDLKSGDDYFMARYYGSTMGRFLSPDDASGQNTGDPQSWNLYSYVRNSPASKTDPDGHDVQVCSLDTNGGGQTCHTTTNDQYKAAQQVGNGGLNVPTHDQVGNSKDSNGNFTSVAITNADGAAGTATYEARNPGIDPYVDNNMAGYQIVGAADKLVTSSTIAVAGVYGAVGGAIAGGEIAASTAAARSQIIFKLAHGTISRLL